MTVHIEKLKNPRNINKRIQQVYRECLKGQKSWIHGVLEFLVTIIILSNLLYLKTLLCVISFYLYLTFMKKNYLVKIII